MFVLMLIMIACRYYINYKLMKKKVKQYSRQLEGGNLERRHVLKDFSRMLDNQVTTTFSVCEDKSVELYKKLILKMNAY